MIGRRVRLVPLVGLAVWIGMALIVRPSWNDLAWPRLLLMLGPLVVVPLGLDVASRASGASRVERGTDATPPDRSRAALLFAALALAGAEWMPRGALAGLLTLPWLAATTTISGAAVARWIAAGARGTGWSERALLGGQAFLVIGGAWTLADRLGLTPIGFDPVIVLLTAAHFHFAGFALPIVTGLAARERPSTLADLACAGVVAGVPAVAIGITLTHLGAAPWLEGVATWLVAGAALASAFLHVALAREPSRPTVVRASWTVAAASLATGMALAATYGSRTFGTRLALDIPHMWAIHGTLNAVGLGSSA